MDIKIIFKAVYLILLMILGLILMIVGEKKESDATYITGITSFLVGIAGSIVLLIDW